MPPGYIAMVVQFAACTALALAPLRRPRALAVAGFVAALAINELPLVAVAWLAVWTLPPVLQGDLASPGGWVVLVVLTMTTIGLAVLARRGLQAGPVVEQAVRDALGNRWAGRPGVVSRRRLVLALLWPLPLRPFGVRRTANIAYGPAGKRHRLDVYRHRSTAPGAPVLLYLHGGGYFSGGKHREGRALLHRFACRGWVCVSATYRLRPAVTHPGHLIDAKRVIAWIRAHAHEYGGDATTLVMAGSSAGAHLSALCALTPGDRALQPGFEDVDTSITAAVCLYGYFGHYYGGIPGEEPIPSSPLSYVGPHAPPFFVVHGDHDTYVPVEGAREFVERLRDASTEPVGYAELSGAQHAFDLFASPRCQAAVDGIEAFLSGIREGDGRLSVASDPPPGNDGP